MSPLPVLSEEDISMEQILGNGSYGIVRKGEWHGKPVAVKLFRLEDSPDGEPIDEQKTRKFHEEARLLHSLDHSNIVKVFAIYQERKTGYHGIVMEIADGGAMKVSKLEEMWAKAGVDKSVGRKKFALGIIEGLKYLHQNGVVHRDLKPDNILCSGPEPTPKITDFGLSKVVENSQVYLKTQAGTPAYMAPEMITDDAGEIRYKKTVDIYSLALILYELFGAGDSRSFFPNCRDLTAIFTAKLRGELPRLNLQQVPQSVADVLSRGVATDPKTRPRLEEFTAAIDGASLTLPKSTARSP